MREVLLIIDLILILFALGLRIAIKYGLETFKISLFMTEYTGIFIIVFSITIIWSLLLKITWGEKTVNVLLALFGIFLYHFSYSIFRPW